MDVAVEQLQDTMVFRINERRVDASQSQQLKRKLFEQIDEGHSFLGIDLSAVRIIDSAGLGVLVATLKRIGQNGCVALWGLSDEVKSVFELTQLYQVFEVFENQDDALIRLRQDATR